MISTRFQHNMKTSRWGQDVVILNKEEMLKILWSSYKLSNLWRYLRIFGDTSKYHWYVRFIYKELGRMGNTQISNKVCVYELRGMFSCTLLVILFHDFLKYSDLLSWCLSQEWKVFVRLNEQVIFVLIFFIIHLPLKDVFLRFGKSILALVPLF